MISVFMYLKFLSDQAVTFFENIYNGVKAFANATDKGVIMTNIASALSEIKVGILNI